MFRIIIIIFSIFFIFIFFNHIKKKTEKNHINLFDNKNEKIQEVTYYQKRDLKDPLPESEALKSIEYYKVFVDKLTGLPIKEEHYEEYSLSDYRIFFYDKKNHIKNIRTYSKDNTLLSDIIYQYVNQEVEKVEFYYTYFSGKDKDIMKSKKRYRNGKRDGVWQYFDRNKSVIKDEFYKNDTLKKSWTKEELSK